MKNIAFVGGGTGGHIFPIKSLIEYVYDNNLQHNFNTILWIGEKNSLEEKISKVFGEKKGYKFVSIYSGKLRRYFDFKAIISNIVDLFKVVIGFFQSIYIIRKYKIDTIFCKGGYVALPFIFAGKLLRIKIFVHESDTIPGLVNKIASKFAKKSFCGFDNALPNCIYTGQIVSNDLLKYENIDIKLTDKKTNVLVMGGSQGSKVMYESLLNILANNSFTDNYNFFVILGLKNIELREQFEKYSNVQCFDFLSQGQIGSLFNICDIGISRGSATSLDEQKYFGMKLIIVPLPFTGGNHQYYNGLKYVDKYYDILVLQDEKLTYNLNSNLIKFQGYKKSKIEEINFDYAKKIIISEILG